MGGAIHSLEKRGEGRREKKRGEAGFRDWWVLGSKRSRFRVFVFFNSNIFGTSKYGKIRLISLLIFFSGDIKCKLKAYDRQYDKQETKEPYKLLEERRKI